ncbi:response regulator [Zobellella sp. DQSA1]|uniref:response regulator n=1 Tax=Zobellella sp. DQSA1 TaxID=3342386 RepID=UPI0035C1CCCF
MYLPRADTGAVTGATEEEPADNMVPLHHGGSECILLVEDDELVRRYAEEQLLGLGFRVLSAGNGHDALTLLQQSDDIDLLFTDVVMPGGMGGAGLAARAKGFRPGIKVLLTSGYTENAIVRHGRLDRGGCCWVSHTGGRSCWRRFGRRLIIHNKDARFPYEQDTVINPGR